MFFASGPNAGKEEIEVIRKQMGLDKPVPEQLLLYLYDVGRGNLGRSLMTGQSVTTDLRERLPASLELTLTALLIALVSAVPLGVMAALKPGSVIDHGVRLFCALGVCVPTFVSGLLADLRLLLSARPRARSDRAYRCLHVAAAVSAPDS